MPIILYRWNHLGQRSAGYENQPDPMMDHSVGNLLVTTLNFCLYFFDQDIAAPELIVCVLLRVSRQSIGVEKCPTGTQLIGKSGLSRRHVAIESINGLLLKI